MSQGKGPPKKGEKGYAEFVATFRKAVEAGGAIVAHVAKNLNVSRQTFYAWIHKDPNLMAAYIDAIEDVDDFVESALLQQIRDKNNPYVRQRAIEYWLNNRRRSKWRASKVSEEVRPTESIDLQAIYDNALRDYREQPGSVGPNARLQAPNE